MFRAFLSTLLISLVAACISLTEDEVRTPGFDGGGSVYHRIAEIESLEDHQEVKRVWGACLSACTLYLGLSTACFEPDTILGFHGPSRPGGAPLGPRQFEHVSALMATFYPPPIAEQFMAVWRHDTRLHDIPAQELIAEGWIRGC